MIPETMAVLEQENTVGIKAVEAVVIRIDPLGFLVAGQPERVSKQAVNFD